jgi:hypothetical protein
MGCASRRNKMLGHAGFFGATTEYGKSWDGKATERGLQKNGARMSPQNTKAAQSRGHEKTDEHVRHK